MPNINIEVTEPTQQALHKMAKDCGMPFRIFMKALYFNTLEDRPAWIDHKIAELKALGGGK